jgi:hypothetical protein
MQNDMNIHEREHKIEHEHRHGHDHAAKPDHIFKEKIVYRVSDCPILRQSDIGIDLNIDILSMPISD